MGIPQDMLDNLSPSTRPVVDLLLQQNAHMQQELQQVKGDLSFMTDIVLANEEDVTDREATKDARGKVLDKFEGRYPRVASPGGTIPKKLALTELRTSDLASRTDLGSPYGPYYSVSGK